jgi:hypothetical protein
VKLNIYIKNYRRINNILKIYAVNSQEGFVSFCNLKVFGMKASLKGTVSQDFESFSIVLSYLLHQCCGAASF